jgi:uncharacterized protein YgiM (DUF1202 family)
MEGLMKKILYFTLLFSSLSASAAVVEAKKAVIGIKYYSEVMGNVHQNPSRYSQVLTTMSCNHPVKIMKETSKDGKDFILFGEDKWNMVTVGPYVGFVMANYLSDKKNVCLEEENSKFFDGLNLDINDFYYWARLYDQYVEAKSQVKQ